MRYSVWNQASGLFDYYDSSRQQHGMNVEKPRHLRASQTLGAAADQAAWPLPADARKVGSGSHAVGRVAARRNGRQSSLGDDVTDVVFDAGLIVLIGALFWKFVLHPSPPRKRSYR